LVDVCGEADPVLFGFLFLMVSAYGFLLCHFGGDFEFEDQLKSAVLHVNAVLVCEGGESLL
jgi:hypothetical protein